MDSLLKPTQIPQVISADFQPMSETHRVCDQARNFPRRIKTERTLPIIRSGLNDALLRKLVQGEPVSKEAQE